MTIPFVEKDEGSTQLVSSQPIVNEDELIIDDEDNGHAERIVNDKEDSVKGSDETEEKACSGLSYPSMVMVGMALVILDLITDLASAVQNWTFGSSERIVHGFLILLPMIGNIIVNHGSSYYRRQEYLLTLDASEEEYFNNSWWSTVGILDPLFWSYKHCRSTGELLQNGDSVICRQRYYRTKQMMQLSIKFEAQTEASFQACLTLFRIHRFFDGVMSLDFCLAIVSFMSSCLSIARAASADLVKTNIKGENDRLINHDGSNVNNSEESKSIQENNKIKHFCKNQTMPWKIFRIIGLTSQTGATLIANVSFVLALYFGWGASNSQGHLPNPNSSAQSGSLSNKSNLEEAATSSASNTLNSTLDALNSTELAAYNPEAYFGTSASSGFIGILFIIAFNTVVQLAWGMIVSRDFFESNYLSTENMENKQVWINWIYFVIRSPFICIFRSGSLYFYSLPRSVRIVALVLNVWSLILLNIIGIIYIKIIGLITIGLFWGSLVCYVICTIVCSTFVEPMKLDEIGLEKQLVVQRIAQLP